MSANTRGTGSNGASTANATTTTTSSSRSAEEQLRNQIAFARSLVEGGSPTEALEVALGLLRNIHNGNESAVFNAVKEARTQHRQQVEQMEAQRALQQVAEMEQRQRELEREERAIAMQRQQQMAAAMMAMQRQRGPEVHLESMQNYAHLRAGRAYPSETDNYNGSDGMGTATTSTTTAASLSSPFFPQPNSSPATFSTPSPMFSSSTTTSSRSSASSSASTPYTTHTSAASVAPPSTSASASAYTTSSSAAASASGKTSIFEGLMLPAQQTALESTLGGRVSTDAPLLMENDSSRAQVLRDAFVDGSSCVCSGCGALVPVARLSVHTKFWCAANSSAGRADADDDDDDDEDLEDTDSTSKIPRALLTHPSGMD